jgi:hypothetical protein
MHSQQPNRYRLRKEVNLFYFGSVPDGSDLTLWFHNLTSMPRESLSYLLTVLVCNNCYETRLESSTERLEQLCC